ncbi:MAG: hypothetical protein OEW64_15225 [Gammaproteobacteria bacterium]|nr:hypothetical protein [Gammaproteobacteria bacterium]MDH5305438.1 hypothetical protein [Gammaproteobacteria bacterium]MDH5323737.1 hypothetical protein [Gammaproteobacteria bacterium]
MTHFEFLTVAISFVLGLAVTVLLTSLLTAFRARRTTRMHWLPLTWACYILVIQFDVWWEVYGLVSMQSWTAGAFVLLLLIALLLFLAGGLVLPVRSADYPSDFDEYFQQDGRWAVAVVAVFQAAAMLANTALFDIEVFGFMNIWNALAIAITVVVVATKRRLLQGAATVAFGVWLVAYIWIFVPGTY